MNQTNRVQLDPSSILQVPIQNYCEDKDFLFIVNGKEFPTNRLISDLLSPKISQIHSVDPTLDTFTINTKSQGDFSRILQLYNFNPQEIPRNEMPFVTEVLQNLNNDKVQPDETEKVELTNDNILNELRNHEQQPNFYRKRLSEEIDYASSHMYELLRTQEKELQSLKLDTIASIINNEHLSIETEDDLLRFVNKLYKSDINYSILYDFVCFANVTSSSISEFISIYDLNDISSSTWQRLCERLEMESNGSKNMNENRYKKKHPKGQIFSPNVWSYDHFSGIINYLREESNKGIENEIEVTASSIGDSGERYQPKTVAWKENSNYYFITNNVEGSWLKIDFKEHKIIPTHYTIRSYYCAQNNYHLKSWVVEVSNDDKSWTIIDEQTNCSQLNGARLDHTFKIQKEQSNDFRYIRIRQTGPNWCRNNHLIIETIEIYGTLF